MNTTETPQNAVAIIGMAGRFPGAACVAAFWANQLAGVEAITRFAAADLDQNSHGGSPAPPNLVTARGILDDADLFDAEFFGILPRDAGVMDPQHRLFLECCWEACEAGGYDPIDYKGPIGVFGGASVPTYLLGHLARQPGFIDRFTSEYQVGSFPELVGNGLDFLATKVAYKLNLRGPAITLGTACSTSLVAVAQACQALLTYQCDMALAGGASISFPQKRGTLHLEGGMTSADGSCRAFDASATGTVFGSGVATVLLKRLDDALADRDHITAVIRGFAVNNDGSAKVGYAAPSVTGQVDVVTTAHAMADVDPATIGYIEAHGTGTPLGDPIEVAALTQAFRRHTTQRQYCTLGTAKTNVGHLDAAAGVTGLINAAHIVAHGVFPPTLHFVSPNPNLDLDNSPFRVVSNRTAWVTTAGAPRRAGVSAFGVGGTNAHVVLEQAPTVAAEGTGPSGVQLLPLSARSETALQAMSARLAKHLLATPSATLADVAWTLQTGRRAFAWRRTVAADSVAGAVQLLAPSSTSRARPVAKGLPEPQFLFPGQGVQFVGMGGSLYRSNQCFRDVVDHCAGILRPLLGLDLRDVLFPPSGQTEDATRQLNQTRLAQPAIFAIEYALARLWMSLGVAPKGLVGHSVGEFVAATIAGVMTLEDALTLVAARGDLMQAQPTGAMTSVRLSEQELASRLPAELSIAAVNAPSLTVAAGPTSALERFEADLTRDGVAHRRLATSHAFHSAMMDGAIAPFRALVATVKLSPPQVPIVSTLTGHPLSDAEATSADYWARHLRETVRFSAAIEHLRGRADALLIEAGPRATLGLLARQHPGTTKDQVIVASLPDNAEPDAATGFLDAVGQVWAAGCAVDWRALHGAAAGVRRKVALPTYPFERKRHWVDAVVREPDALLPVQKSLPEVPTLLSSPGPVPMTLQTPPLPSRRTVLHQEIVALFEQMSGSSLAGQPVDATFVELGFDSLFLTQVVRGLQTKFGVKITFRQLLGDLSSVDALSEHLDATLPPDKFAPVAAAPPPVAPAPLAAPTVDAASPAQPLPVAGTGGAAIERLMRDQLDIMNQVFARQLAVIQSAGAPAVRIAAANISDPPAPQAKLMPVQLPKPQEREGDAKQTGPYKPLPPRTTAKFDARQQAHLDALIERFVQRTAKSKAYTERSRKALADPRAVSGFRDQWKELIYPIVTSRSKGSKLWDLDGNEYIDLLNGFGPIMLGHRPDFIEAALAHQLSEGFEIGPQSPLAGEVADLLFEITGNERATFCNTGSEAVMAALRIARTATGRDKVVYFSGAYHGMFDEVLVKSARGPDGGPASTPIAPGIPQSSAANMVVLEYGSAQSLDWIRANADKLAAVLVEPVQSRRPGFQPIEFLRELRAITEAAGTVLIFDEVVTGFRVHAGGCQALFGIRADLVTYGKVVGGGMPVGVLAGKAAYMDILDGGTWRFGDDSRPEVGVTFFAGTFVRHPLTLAAVKAVLLYLRDQGPKLHEQLNARTNAFVASINAIFERYAIPTRADNFGSVMFFAFPPDERYASLFYFLMRERGVHILEGFPSFLTTAHSDADLAHVLAAFDYAAGEMRRTGFLLSAPPAGWTLPAEASVAATVAELPQAFALTEPQREIYLAAILGDEISCSFNESVSVHFKGSLDVAALTGALNEIIVRHEALRGTIDMEQALFRIHEARPLDVAMHDFSDLSDADREAAVADLLAADARCPFNLAEGPLVRAELVRRASDDHQLILTAHHIVCDGWSLNVIVEDLAELYSAQREARAPHLDAATAFSAYARGLAVQRGMPGASDAEHYWLERFRDKPLPIELPTDRPRQGARTFAGATRRLVIPGDVYRSIKQAGVRNGASLFVTLLAGLTALLYRLTSQDDVVIAVPVAGQSQFDGGGLVGHCVNFLPMRTLVDGEADFSELLSTVKGTVLDAYEHQSYTYGTLVQKLQVVRDPARLPLTEIQFNLEQVGGAATFAGLQCSIDPNPKAAVNFDLFVNVIESADGLTIDCDYNTDLYDEATVARWLGHYETLLQGVARNPQTSVGRLPLLTSTERDLLVRQWNDTHVAFPSEPATIHGLFEAQVRRVPGKTAVIFGDQQLTYAELDARATRLALRLRELGVKPGARVGIFIERSLDIIVGLLGVLKCGGAYVPMDPTYPPDRVRFILDDCEAAVVVTGGDLAKNWSFGSAQVLDIAADRRPIEVETVTPLTSLLTAADTAYVIYTSGSTGKPKGVEVRHHSVVNLLRSMQATPGLTDADTLAAITTLSFDIAGLELFLPLHAGATLAIVSRENAQLGANLLAELRRVGATVMQATPISWQLLIEAGWTGTPALKVLCGGEAFPRDVANALAERSVSVWNMYGPTETTIWSATARVTAGTESVPLGAPIANTQFHVLDARLELVPIGVPGELHIGGDGLAAGYFKRPELTAERFIANPLPDALSPRLYKTGDAVRRRADGTLEFLGRLDTQIKLRGYRIELGEIEAAISSQPGVTQAVVIVREDAPGDKRLVAYLIGKDGQVPASADLRAALESRLPAYMIPAAFLQLEHYPLTPNGKINRLALPAPDWARSTPTSNFEAPTGAEEELLARIWAEVLAVPRVGATDSLFELGADSLRVFQITSRAQKAGLPVTPRMMLQQRTIRKIIAEMKATPAADQPAFTAIKPVVRQRFRLTQ